MDFDNNQPIYLQIMADFKRKLTRGALQPGGAVAPVRELALAYGVNPNTMQKALSELERAGYLRSERTAGRAVTDDAALIERLRDDERGAAVRRFVDEMRALGVPRERLPELLAKENTEIKEGK